MPTGNIEQKKWRIFACVAIGVFMSTLDGSIVNIALPVIMKELKGTFAGTEWVIMIYLLTVTSLLLTFGRLSDIFGRRRIYGTGFFVFASGSLLCSLAHTTGWLVIFRALQGVGAAMLMACSSAIIVDTFPEKERGRILGFNGTVVATGLTTGPALGGLLIHLFSWRAIFYVNVPIGFIAGVAVFIMFKGSRLDVSRPEPFDWGGALTLAFCLGGFLLAVTHGYDWGIVSFPFLFALSISIVMTGVFIGVERRFSKPIFDFSLIRIRRFILPVLSAVFLFMSLFTVVFLMPFYLMVYRGVPDETAGYIMITPFVFLSFIAPVAGTLSDRIGSRLLCTVGLIVVAVSMFTLMQIPSGADFTAIIWRLALAGIGIALFVSPNVSTAMSAISLPHRGVASGTIASARNLGMVLGIAMAGAVFNTVFRMRSGGIGVSSYHPGLGPEFAAAFQWAMFSGMAIALIGAVTAYLRGPDGP